MLSDMTPIDLRTELLALTALRRRVVKENDTISRIFAAYRKDETPVPTWDDLNRAQATLESKVPGLIAYYVKEADMFTLAPDMDYVARTPAPESERQP